MIHCPYCDETHAVRDYGPIAVALCSPVRSDSTPTYAGE